MNVCLYIGVISPLKFLARGLGSATKRNEEVSEAVLPEALPQRCVLAQC